MSAAAPNDSQLNARMLTATVLIWALMLIGIAAYFTEAGWVYLVVAFIACGQSAGEFALVCSGNLACKGTALVYFLLALFPLLVILSFFFRLGLAESQFVEKVGFSGVAASFFFSSIGAVSYIIFVSRNSVERGARVARDLFPGLLIVGFGGACLMNLTVMPAPHRILLWLILVVSSNDTAAYFVGKRVGGPRLSPAISPGKTISGSVAGLAAGTLVGLLLAGLIGEGRSIVSLTALSVLTVITAQLGDLVKSYIKRLHEVKDMGSILPGHGGVLDRIDGILMASPVVFCWLILPV